MKKFLYNWRYYSYGQEKYNECMGDLFKNNLSNLQQVNKLVVILAICFSPFPLFIEKSPVNAVAYFLAAFIAFILSAFINYKMQTGNVSNRLIYLLTTIFFINIMSFSIYLSIWSTPDKLATLFLCFIICALLFLINPPFYNLILIFVTVFIFSVCTVFNKSTENAVYDISNAIVAGILSIYFNWHITKLRMGLELSANMLEDERNIYFSQSTIDELTRLNNRRDFMHTFQRYLSSYRTSDDWLCVSISDIDFFKNYNDFYGHPKGDDCLRSVGAAFTRLKENLGVYVARVGGEEFAMLWFEKDAKHVDNIISVITQYIKEMKVPHEKSSINEYVTMSMGVYIEKLGEQTNVQTLYDLADKALYAAKGSGRNCTIVTGRGIEQYKITPEP